MIYEYECPFCAVQQEIEHGMTKTPKVICKSCGAKCKKIISGGSGFILKGGGWGADGYGPKKKEKKGKKNPSEKS